MYQAGEFIVYGTNSVCRVESIGKPPFETEEDTLYYTLVPVTGTETIYIPTDSPVFTRPVISREKAEELINSIPDIEEDHFVCHSVRLASWKKRRQRKLQNKWKKRGFVASLFQSVRKMKFSTVYLFKAPPL